MKVKTFKQEYRRYDPSTGLLQFAVDKGAMAITNRLNNGLMVRIVGEGWYISPWYAEIMGDNYKAFWLDSTEVLIYLD